jgi:hypothetical protein
MRKAGIALGILVLVAGCADSAGPDTPQESVLPGTVVAPLVVASADVRDRLLPALGASTQVGAIDDAMAELQVALATGLPTPITAATATLRAALDAAASNDPPGLGPDRDAIRLLVYSLELALAGAGS